MSLHVEYECIMYIRFFLKLFLFILLVLKAENLDHPFGLSLSLHYFDFN